MTVSVKSWAVLSSFLTTTFSADFFFRSYFATNTAQNVPCIIIHGQLSLPRKVAANHQAYLFFWPNINMSWKGQNVTCRFNMFSMVFPSSGTPLGEFMTSKYNLVFILFFIHWRYIFLVVFLFVSENGTVSEWVSHNNEERTIRLIQDIRRHLLITVECPWTLPHNITHGNARLHGFNFTHGGICLQIKWQPRFSTHFYLKTADSIQSLIFSKIYDFAIANRSSESDHIKLLILFCRPIHAA